MKQIKKTKQRWTLLSILPIAGMMTVAMSLAAPVLAAQFNAAQFNALPRSNIPITRNVRQPIQWPADLKASITLVRSSIRKTNSFCAQGCTWNYTISGSVQNVGRGAFVPASANAQTLSLSGPDRSNVSRAHVIHSWPFGRLNPGQKKSVSIQLRNQPGPSTEFVADYSMQINFGPDSPGDRNRSNNKATLRWSTVASTLSHVITVRPVSAPVTGTVTPARSCPDLAIQSVRVMSESRISILHRRLRRVRLEVKVANIGNADYPEGRHYRPVFLAVGGHGDVQVRYQQRLQGDVLKKNSHVKIFVPVTLRGGSGSIRNIISTPGNYAEMLIRSVPTKECRRMLNNRATWGTPGRASAPIKSSLPRPGGFAPK